MDQLEINNAHRESEKCVCVCGGGDTYKESFEECSSITVILSPGKHRRELIGTRVHTNDILTHARNLVCAPCDTLPPSAAKFRVKKWVDSSWKTSLSFNSFLYPISIMGN